LLDFWLLPDAKLTGNLAARVEANFYARVPPEERPAMYRNLESAANNSVAARAPLQNDKEAALETLPSTPTQESKEDPSSDRPGVFQRRGTGVTPTTHFGKQKGTPNYDRSLAKALHAAFWRRWWLCGLAKLIGDTLKTTAPLVNKELLTWLAKVYIYYRLPEQARPVFPVKLFQRPR
jgi:ATP-binding cassette subfamily C (CFTR/MRP) protein 1